MRNYILLGVVVLFISAGSWIGLSVYDSVAGVDVDSGLDIYLQPIAPEFDHATIELVESRVGLMPVDAKVFRDLELTEEQRKELEEQSESTDEAQTESGAGDSTTQ